MSENTHKCEHKKIKTNQITANTGKDVASDMTTGQNLPLLHFFTTVLEHTRTRQFHLSVFLLCMTGW